MEFARYRCFYSFFFYSKTFTGTLPNAWPTLHAVFNNILWEAITPTKFKGHTSPLKYGLWWLIYYFHTQIITPHYLCLFFSKFFFFLSFFFVSLFRIIARFSPKLCTRHEILTTCSLTLRRFLINPSRSLCRIIVDPKRYEFFHADRPVNGTFIMWCKSNANGFKTLKQLNCTLKWHLLLFELISLINNHTMFLRQHLPTATNSFCKFFKDCRLPEFVQPSKNVLVLIDVTTTWPDWHRSCRQFWQLC